MASGLGTAVVIQGLTNGQAYTFTAAHTYENGEISGASAASNAIVPQNPFPPEKVAAVGGKLFAAVSWTQREGLGSEVTGFEIEMDPPRAAGRMVVGPNTRHAIVDGLETAQNNTASGAAYRVRVHAVAGDTEQTASP